MSDDDKAIKEAIRKLILDSLEIDQNLRDQYQTGNKFRFIRDRLTSLQARIEEELQTSQAETAEIGGKLGEDEILVYVHIFNAQGLVFSTWQKLVSASVFYEYSVNRPIYTNKAQVESFIRSRPNKVQHGFLTVALKKDAVLSPPEGQEAPKDQIGHPLIKIREGSLQFNRLLSFTHQETEYIVDNQGHVIKKPESSHSN